MTTQHPKRTLLPSAEVVKAQRKHEHDFYEAAWVSFSEGMKRWANERLDPSKTGGQ